MFSHKLTRKIFQTGKYSYVISVPKELIKHLGWQRGELVEVDLDKTGKRLTVQKFKF